MAAADNNQFVGNWVMCKDGVSKKDFIAFLKDSGIGMIKRNAAWSLVGSKFGFDISVEGDVYTIKRTLPAECTDIVPGESWNLRDIPSTTTTLEIKEEDGKPCLAVTIGDNGSHLFVRTGDNTMDSIDVNAKGTRMVRKMQLA